MVLLVSFTGEVAHFSCQYCTHKWRPVGGVREEQPTSVYILSMGASVGDLQCYNSSVIEKLSL